MPVSSRLSVANLSTAKPGAPDQDGHRGFVVKKTAATELYERVREDILRCILRPGARLLFKDLTAAYGSGISQLREALMRLAADGWVVLESGKGFSVAPVSPEELRDITQMRCELEGMAIRMSIEKGDLHWEANILARHHEVSNIPILQGDGTLNEVWNTANDTFHRTLYSACGSPLLLVFCNLLRERFGRYRRLWPHYGNPMSETSKDHENLVKATIGRDTQTAISLTSSHLTRVSNNILEHWSAEDAE